MGLPAFNRVPNTSGLNRGSLNNGPLRYLQFIKQSFLGRVCKGVVGFVEWS